VGDARIKSPGIQPPSLGKLRGGAVQISAESVGGGEVEVFSLAHLPYAQAKRLAMRAFERRYLSALLEKSGNNVSSAARAAGVDRSNFRRLLKQYEVGGRSNAKPNGTNTSEGQDGGFESFGT